MAARSAGLGPRRLRPVPKPMGSLRIWPRSVYCGSVVPTPQQALERSLVGGDVGGRGRDASYCVPDGAELVAHAGTEWDVLGLRRIAADVVGNLSRGCLGVLDS